MNYIKYFLYSVVIILVLGSSVLTSLQYFAPEDDMQYYYIAYDDPETVTFCLNDPDKNIKYKEKVLYVRPITKSSAKANSSQRTNAPLLLPTHKTPNVQKDFMEFYIVPLPSEKR